MSMRHTDPRPFRHRTRKLSRVLVVFAAALLVGCGGSDAPNDASSDSPSPEPASVEAGDSTGSENAGESTSPATPAMSATPAVPAGGSGIQLPDQAVEIGDEAGAPSGQAQPESGGPTQPGAGGIEMPDLDPAPPSDDSSDDSAADAGQSNSGVDLQFASWSAIESHAKSTGKITVVDLWSTVCEPCVKEFPGLVRLSKSMSDDVVCIGVAVDYDGRKSRPPEYYSDKVTAFLGAMGADFENYLCNTPSDDVFATVGIPSIPAVLIFDADGKQVKQFVDAGDTVGFSYEADVVPFVEKLAG
ncbi:thiol-disulfide oxidoreductase [Stieleria neptunia]|uniref:Thiol-disulfide oxidoreductase n=1 Tax=Stieleria neptunia TaxID=2527979 RepID=A0A518I205_9BACT|nr:TlpA disulfide reductase family protein [Stieleria neptunia]QDV47118.1 thiol-disulfide oxidoreductase [Stieleria neptunia]